MTGVELNPGGRAAPARSVGGSAATNPAETTRITTATAPSRTRARAAPTDDLPVPIPLASRPPWTEVMLSTEKGEDGRIGQIPT